MTHQSIDRSFINARRNHSNCSVIELYLTRSNLIERLGSIKFGNRTQWNQKNPRESSIKFVFRTQSNPSNLKSSVFNQHSKQTRILKSPFHAKNQESSKKSPGNQQRTKKESGKTNNRLTQCTNVEVVLTCRCD